MKCAVVPLRGWCAPIEPGGTIRLVDEQVRAICDALARRIIEVLEGAYRNVGNTLRTYPPQTINVSVSRRCSSASAWRTRSTTWSVTASATARGSSAGL